MKFTNKWMVVPYNPAKIEQETSVTQTLSKVLRQPKNSIDKVKEYNQILAKNSQQNHPVVPVQTNFKEENDDDEYTTFNESDNNNTLNRALELSSSDNEGMDISVHDKLSLPPPLKLPANLSKSTKKSDVNIQRISKRSKRTAPYPSPKKTRAFYQYKNKNYLTRPFYEDSELLKNETKSKNGDIIELEKTKWQPFI